MTPFFAKQPATTFRKRVTEKFPCLLLLLFGLSLSGCTSQGGRVSEEEKSGVHFQVGLGFFSEGNYPAALQQFLMAKELEPDQPQIGLQLGLTYMKMHRLSLAKTEILPLCEKNPGWAECWNNLAAVYLEAKEPRKAAQSAEKALSIITYSTPELAWANLAQAELQLKEYTKALAAVQKAHERMPENCQLKILSTNILIEQGAYEDGLREAKLGTSLCPQEGLPHLWEAYAYYKLGDLRQAQRKYRAVIEQFRRGPAAEQGVLALDLMKRKIPLSAPQM